MFSSHPVNAGEVVFIAWKRKFFHCYHTTERSFHKEETARPHTACLLCQVWPQRCCFRAHSMVPYHIKLIHNRREGWTMASNQDKIFEKYSARSEDGREKQSRNDGLEYYYTKKHLEGFITKEDRILEIGCATGHYGFYYADKCKAYVGIDLYPPHIELFSRRIQEGNFLHLSCRTGDAVNLNGFPDGSFDVVLSLGPMYHLSAPRGKGIGVFGSGTGLQGRGNSGLCLYRTAWDVCRRVRVRRSLSESPSRRICLFQRHGRRAAGSFYATTQVRRLPTSKHGDTAGGIRYALFRCSVDYTT